MRASYIFLNKLFWKSPFNVVFAFVVPFIFICAVCGSWTLMNELEPVMVFPACSYMSIVFISLLVMPSMIYEYRKANIIRRIEDSGRGISSFIFAAAAFFGGLFLLSYFFSCSVGTLVLVRHQTIREMWMTANYASVLYSFFITVVLSGCIGLTIGLNAKSLVFVQVFGISSILISVFAAFWIMPLALVSAEPKLNPITWISYMWPYRYITDLFTQSWLQSYSFNAFHVSVFNFSTSYSSALWVLDPKMSSQTWFQVITPLWKVLDIFVPIAIIGGFVTFNWISINRKAYHEAL